MPAGCHYKDVNSAAAQVSRSVNELRPANTKAWEKQSQEACISFIFEMKNTRMNTIVNDAVKTSLSVDCSFLGPSLLKS